MSNMKPLPPKIYVTEEDEENEHGQVDSEYSEDGYEEDEDEEEYEDCE